MTEDAGTARNSDRASPPRRPASADPVPQEAVLFFDDFETPLLDVRPTSITFGGEPAALCEAGADHIDMWYTGPGNRIHYASSTDGVNFAGTPTDIPAGFIRSTVLKKDDTYYVYGSDDRNIRLYASRDRVHFEARGVALAGDAGGDGSVANSFVWVENGLWHMLYEAMRDNRWAICLATAATPTGFTDGRYAGNPVLGAPGLGSGNPELFRIGSQPIRLQGRYYLLYHRAENWRAWSTDLHSWTQEGILWGFDKTDPVGYSCGDASVCEFRNRTYIWKSLSDQVSRSFVTVAIAEMPLREFLSRNVPVSAANWEDAMPDGGYSKYPDVDTTLAKTGKSSIYLRKQYWRSPTDIAIRHAFRPSGPVVVTAWVHEDAAATPAQAHVAVSDTNSAHPVSAGVDTGISGTHYVVTCDGKSTASAVVRRNGWHKFEFIVRGNGTEVRIDDVRIGRAATMTAATAGYIALWNNKDMPLNGSVDSITIRRA